MTKRIRPSANYTRAKILEAARSQFLDYGFKGSSIKLIAEAAQVNTNLIFHHFTNKETLWLKVKESIVSEQSIIPQYDLTSAKLYFKSILDYRFELYEHAPDLVRLIQWQQLTEDEAVLISNDISSPNNWLVPLETFQTKGNIKSNIDPKHILLFIIFSTYAPFLQHIIPFTVQQKLDYKNMILEMCCSQFLTENNM
ncbi:MAG: TetR family transcriptional regulator [Burkholderiales bacterium]|jgi:AcrR family transcriptional regulator|nr:TetR family transcriptional regulator [Burkholderiales bacterium]